MTVKGYISSKLGKLYLNTTDEELEAALAELETDGDAEYNKDTARGANIVLLGIIPELLAMPDIAEDSFSVKFNRDAIVKFCAIIAGRYGINDPLATPSEDSIIDQSHVW